MGVLLKQLHDDLAPFYPITCARAVVGGTISEATIPEVIDLSEYITENFKTSEFSGIFRMDKYDTNLYRIIVEVDKNPYYNIFAGGNNIIASDMPVRYYPDRPIILKTMTDDIRWKCIVVWDTDGKLRLCTIPHENITITVSEEDNSKEIHRFYDGNVEHISATTIRII